MTLTFDALHNANIARLPQFKMLGLFSQIGEDGRLYVVWADSCSSAASALSAVQPMVDQLLFLNTRLGLVNGQGGGEAIYLNEPPPEHLRFVGTLTEDGRVPVGDLTGDQTQALAQEIMTVTRAADKAIETMRKLLDGETAPLLDDFCDVDDLRRHLHASGALAYAEIYSEDEMRDALAFLHSPSGQAMEAKLPAIQQRIEASLQAYMLANMAELTTKD